MDFLKEIERLESEIPQEVMLPLLTAGNEGFIQNFTVSVSGFFNRVINGVLHVASEIKELGSPTVVKEVREATAYATLTKINYIVQHGNYINLGDTLVVVPTSLKTPMWKHIENLNSISEEFFEDFDIIIDDAIDFLSRMVNDRDYRTNIRVKLPSSLLTLNRKINLVNDMVKKDYSTKNTQAVKYKDFTKSNSMLLKMREDLDKPVGVFSIKKIFKANDKIVKIKNIVDAIDIQVQEDGFDTNGKTYKMIVTLVDELSKYLTASGLLLNDIAMTSRAFVESVDIIRDKV